MLPFLPDLPPGEPLKVLCLGAHADDIEIGAGGTLLTWAERHPMDVQWVVFTGDQVRAEEARGSARWFLAQGRGMGDLPSRVQVHGHRPSFLPSHWEELKQTFFDLRARFEPHLVLTHHLHDRHQDHRLISELTWNTFRDHTILEYEIAKYEGDLGQPGVFVPITESVVQQKIDAISRHFVSQTGKTWFDESAFRALMRLRGIECNSPSGYAEAFHGRKLCL